MRVFLINSWLPRFHDTRIGVGKRRKGNKKAAHLLFAQIARGLGIISLHRIIQTFFRTVISVLFKFSKFGEPVGEPPRLETL